MSTERLQHQRTHPGAGLHLLLPVRGRVSGGCGEQGRAPLRCLPSRRAGRINRGRTGLLRRIFRNRAPPRSSSRNSASTVYRCTLCGRCQEVCPAESLLKDIWVSLRQDLVHSKAYPKKMDMIRENLEESHNVFAEDNEERADWVEDMRRAGTRLPQGSGRGGLLHRVRGSLFSHGPEDPGGACRDPRSRRAWISRCWAKRSGAAGFPSSGRASRRWLRPYMTQPGGGAAEGGEAGRLRLPVLLPDVAGILPQGV